jgi:hypothetical protein
MGFNPKTQQKIKLPAKTRRQISRRKGRGLAGKEVVFRVAKSLQKSCLSECSINLSLWTRP